jgi:hypothetical protein
MRLSWNEIKARAARFARFGVLTSSMHMAWLRQRCD